MHIKWTSNQILSFAPDQFVAEAARRVAFPASWLNLSQQTDTAAVWGEYLENQQQTQHAIIDLMGPTFYCTCPSYKFPCKHVVGLFLLLAEQPNSFTETRVPGWVQEWLDDRESATPRAKRVAKPNKKRVAQRQAKIEEGLADLELWFQDLLRRGLAHLQGKPSSPWEEIAARMVDAQATNVARELRSMATIPNSGGNWPARLLQRIGRLNLLIQGFKHFDEQTPETQADLRAAVGWTPRKNELLHLPRIQDNWNVVGSWLERDGRLRIQRRWLIGEQTGRTALLLDYAHGRQMFKSNLLIPGSAVTADLIFYPSAAPLRAFVAEQTATVTPITRVRGHATIALALQSYTAAIARNPWLPFFHLAIAQLIPVQDGKRWHLTDTQGHSIPIRPKFSQAWHLFSLSGGHPVMLFGEWDGEAFSPLSVLVEGRWLDLTVMRGVL